VKFLVLGHLCLDVIHPVNGPEVQSYGGIYYSIATLAGLLQKTDTVVPVFGVNRNDYGACIEHLGRFPNVDTSAIYEFDEPTNRVHLYYHDGGNRTECSKDIANPIPYEKIQPRLSADGILVNMVSGFDITIETLDQLRMNLRPHRTPVHFDYHSLTLGVRGNNERFRRPVQDWRRWAFMMDTVQLNEQEMAGLTVEGLGVERAAGHLLTLGVKGVLVTRGERGVTLFRNDHKKVVRKDIAGVTVDRVLDSTGCGDVFGAAFLFQYVKTSDLAASAEFANRLAASKVRAIGAATMQLHEFGEHPG
jgi:adenosine kinase